MRSNLVCSLVATTVDKGLKSVAVRWSRVDYAAGARTTTLGVLAVSAGALKMADRASLPGFSFYNFFL